jgi:branched-chain amino acid transport system permease protein
VLGGSHKIKVFVTFGVGIVATNAILIIFGGAERTVHVDGVNEVLQVGSVRASWASVIAFVVAIVVAVALYLLMNKTMIGKSIRATGQNPLAAQLVGININRARWVMFGLSTALLGIAGPILIPIYSAYPTVGFDFVLIMFITIVLGGLGSFKGAVIGGLIVGVIQSVGGYYMPPELQGSILFILLILILIVRPQGLYGRAKLVGSAEKSVL